MTTQVDYLIIGGGVCGARCAVTLRSERAVGSVMLVSAEAYPPYNRPPLSKGLLLGTALREQIFALSEKYCHQNEIELRLNTRVESLDADEKLAVADGEEYRYGRALVATGCDPRRLEIEGGGLGNIFYLRRLDDSDAIKRAMESSKSAVIIGAGFIGMELASAFARKGIETTMIVRGDALWEKLGSKKISDFFRELYQERGVDILFGEETDRLEGEKGLVKRAVTKSGKTVPCDMVAVGIGVTPAAGFVTGSRVVIDNGIVVDEHLRTGDPDLFAAGDVANFYDPLLDTRWRIEHWDNAIKQGELAAKNMLDHDIAYNTVSYFFSDVFDQHYEFLGDNRGADEIIYRGSFDERSMVVLYLADSRLKAAFILGPPIEERTKVESLIKSKKRLGNIGHRLADTSFDLSEAA